MRLAQSGSYRTNRLVLGGIFLFLGRLLLAALLGGGVLGKRYGHAAEGKREAEHQSHQFFHFAVSPWRFDELTCRLGAMISNLT